MDELINKNSIFRRLFISLQSNHYLGREEFAQVWEVQRIKDGRKSAVKIIDKQTCFGQVNGKEAIYNKIQILKKLDHPNIVHLECVYESQKNIYIVLQYIPGMLLSEFFQKSNHSLVPTTLQSTKRQLNIRGVKALLNAVQYLHKLNIAHRDIKPGNIIIDQENGCPCIIDFGLSQMTQKSQYLFQCCGSPGYMAPELFSEQKILDLKKCDIFSLGAIFYLILTGKPLFDGKSPEDIINQIKNGQKTIKNKINSNLKKFQSKLLLQMLDYNPAKRILIEAVVNHEYFIELMYDNLSQVRKTNASASSSSKYSVHAQNKQNKFQQLFSESMVFMENQTNKNIGLLTDKLNFNNMVTTSVIFNQKLKNRNKRYLSQQNIQVDLSLQEKVTKLQWSGKWKNFKTLQRLLQNTSFWGFKDHQFSA